MNHDQKNKRSGLPLVVILATVLTIFLVIPAILLTLGAAFYVGSSRGMPAPEPLMQSTLESALIEEPVVQTEPTAETEPATEAGDN